MAVIPTTYEKRRVAGFQRPIARIGSAGMVGRAVQGLGVTADRVAAMLDRERQEDDAADATERDTRGAGEIDLLLNDPESGFLFTEGGVAVNSREGVLEKLEAIKERSLDGASNGSRKRLGAVLDRRMLQARSQINRHTGVQRKVRLVGAVSDAINRDVNAVLSGDLSFEDGLERAAGLAAGMPEETGRKILNDARSRLATARVETLLRTDPEAAYAGLRGAEWDAYLTPDVKARLMRRGAVDAGERYGGDLHARLTAFKGGGFRTAIAAKDWGAAATAVAPLVEWQETRGRSGAISPKDARGLMQVMPDTGREWAARLGLPFDLDRLTNDDAYNRQIGTAILAHNLEKYDGNIALVLAAYNAGDGRLTGPYRASNGTMVKGWIERFGTPGKDIPTMEWIAKIPFLTTREYVTEIVKNMAGGDPSGILGAAIEKDAPHGEAAIRGYNRAAALSKQTAALREGQLTAAAVEHIRGGGKFEDLPSAIRDGLSVTAEKSLRAYSDARGKIVTDPATHLEFYKMSISKDPAVKAAFKALNLDNYVHLLDTNAHAKVSKWQADVIEGKDISLTMGWIKTEVEFLMPDKIEWDKPGDAKTAGVLQIIEAEQDAYVEREGKAPDGRAKREIVRRAIAGITLDSGAWYVSDPEKKAFELADELAAAHEAREPYAIDLADDAHPSITITPEMVDAAMSAGLKARGYAPSYLQILEGQVDLLMNTPAAATPAASAADGAAPLRGPQARNSSAPIDPHPAVDPAGALATEGKRPPLIFPDGDHEGEIDPAALVGRIFSQADVDEIAMRLGIQLSGGDAVDFGGGLVLSGKSFNEWGQKYRKQFGDTLPEFPDNLSVLLTYILLESGRLK